jgi:predicted DNA-binding transcriptional regulator AlpA
MKQKTVGRSALARALGVSRATLWRYERDGLIPAPARLSRNRVGFSRGAIQAAANIVGVIA